MNSFIRFGGGTDGRRNVIKGNDKKGTGLATTEIPSSLAELAIPPAMPTIHRDNTSQMDIYSANIGETDPRNNPENERFSPLIKRRNNPFNAFNLTAYTSFVGHPSDIRPFHLSSAIYARRLNGGDFRGFRCLKENLIKIVITILLSLVAAVITQRGSMYLVGAKKLVLAILLPFLYFYFPFSLSVKVPLFRSTPPVDQFFLRSFFFQQGRVAFVAKNDPMFRRYFNGGRCGGARFLKVFFSELKQRRR